MFGQNLKDYGVRTLLPFTTKDLWMALSTCPRKKFDRNGTKTEGVSKVCAKTLKCRGRRTVSGGLGGGVAGVGTPDCEEQ